MRRDSRSQGANPCPGTCDKSRSEKSFRTEVKVSPAAHEALTKTQALLENAQWTEADVVLRRFIEEFSREPVAHATAWHMLGFLLSRTGRDGEALKAYEKALEHDALDVILA